MQLRDRPRMSPRRLLSILLAAVAMLCVDAVFLCNSGSAASPFGENGVLRLGFRTDAAPFSYCAASTQECLAGGCAFKTRLCPGGLVDGYSVRLCKRIYEALLADGKVSGVRVVPVSTQRDATDNRFKMLADKEIDILCGATTVTLERMRDFRATLFTFLSGASVIHSSKLSIDSVMDLQGLAVGVLNGTTTATMLEAVKAAAGKEGAFSIVTVASHRVAMDRLKQAIDGGRSGAAATAVPIDEAVTALPDFGAKGDSPPPTAAAGVGAPSGGRPGSSQGDPAPDTPIDVYFADREILLWMTRDPQIRSRWTVSSSYFSFEPYALFLNRESAELQFEANIVLADLFGNQEELGQLFSDVFGRAATSDLLQAMFRIQRIPEKLGAE